MKYSTAIYKIILSCIIGIFIGLDQKHKGKEAGPKTHAFVCLGSALVVIAGTYIDVESTGRIAGQVITGIGFLGAGTILIKDNKQIQGLTTAAGIWLVACIGIVIATDGWPLAIVATLCWYIITHIFANKDEEKRR